MRGIVGVPAARVAALAGLPIPRAVVFGVEVAAAIDAVPAPARR